MDNHFKDYFHPFSEETPSGNFHKVIALHEAPDLNWKTLSKQVPDLPRAWCELAQLTVSDRIEFTRDYWESTMTYHPGLTRFLDNFFSNLDDIGVFITQKKYDDSFKIQLVYSISDNRGFYRGEPAAKEAQILDMEEKFPEFILPPDYIAFFKIHNGFYKTTDETGLTKAEELYDSFQAFQAMFENEEVIYTKSGDPVNRKKLIPFYIMFGMPFYQCFWEEWYPSNEMGNVYFDSLTRQISDPKESGGEGESLSFPTFTDWLMFYLEILG